MGKTLRVFLWASVLALATGCDSLNEGGAGTFSSQLTVEPDSIFVGCLTSQECTVTARVTLGGAATEVVLNEVASADGGGVVEEVGEMFDDGDANYHGDDIGGDHVYSIIATFNPTEAGFLYLQASADGKTSDVVTVGVHEHLTDAEWTEATQTIPDAANTCVASSADVDAAVSCVAAIPGVAKAAKSEEGRGIWYVTEHGILGGVMPTEIDAPDAESDTDLNKKGGAPVFDTTEVRARPMVRLRAKVSGAVEEGADPDAVGSKAAVYVGPYLWDFGARDDYHGAWKLIQKSECPKFDTTEIKNASAAEKNVTPATFKTLSKYGIVVISTHGDNWYNGLFTEWKDLFGDKAATPAPRWLNPFSSDMSSPMLLSGYKTTDDVAKTYESDLLWHRLAVSGSKTYAITPSFIRFHNGTFPDSIVYMSACRSAYNSDLADAFIAKGAGAVIGYSDYVYAGWAFRHGNAIFGPDPLNNVVNSMLPLTDPPKKPKVQSIKNAFDASVAEYGESTRLSAPHGAQGGTGANGAYDAADTDNPYIRLYPSDAKRNLNVPPILNGGFEKGSAIGWTSSGDYRALAAVGDVSAPEGSYMGLITTGLGTYGTELTESVLQQSMCIPANVTAITFQYDFMTEEAMCYIGAGYDDTFVVELLDPEGTVLDTAVTESVDLSDWGFLGGDMFAGGDDYSTPQTCVDEEGNEVYGDGTFHTNWQNGSIDVKDYAGNAKPHTLRFRIWDEGDSVWDSAAAIDDVKLQYAK